MAAHDVVRLGIAQVPEGRRVFAPLTVQQNLELGAFSRRDRHEIVEDLDVMYTRFPALREKQRQQSGTLSGGQQQMLAIARALMARPKVLLMDEPAAGLAPAAVDEMAEIITAVNRGGITIVVVEHNIKLG